MGESVFRIVSPLTSLRNVNTLRVFVRKTMCCPLTVPSIPPDWFGPLKWPLSWLPFCKRCTDFVSVAPLESLA